MLRTILCSILLLICPLYSSFVHAEQEPSIPFELPSSSDVLKIKSAVIITNHGKIYLELFPEDAPWHVANFKYRSDKGYYKNVSFDIVYPDYIVQGGLPHKKDPNDISYSLPPEFNDHPHEPGILGMARTPDEKNLRRRSSCCQFHILTGDNPKMDHNFTVFGKVVKGIDVVENIKKGDRIRDVVVFVRE